MSTTKFYQIISSYFENGEQFYLKLDDAKADARDAAAHEGMHINVDRVEANTSKEGIVKLANRSGWCLSRETVYTANARIAAKARLGAKKAVVDPDAVELPDIEPLPEET